MKTGKPFPLLVNEDLGTNKKENHSEKTLLLTDNMVMDLPLTVCYSEMCASEIHKPST